jgi:tRNA uridine 5-carboxymethylaminomethyl modification enzyme
MAGANAALSIKKEGEFVLDRSEAYIGVMIDDLTTHGITEPYRMFTSRAEHRLLLSQSNAEQRLLRKAHKIKLVDDERMAAFCQDEEEYKKFVTNILEKTKVTEFTNKKKELIKLSEKKSIATILTRPDIDENTIFETTKENKKHLARAAVEIKYKGYIEKQLREIHKNKKQNHKKIPTNFSYANLSGLSNEVVEKLLKAKPETIGSASKIEGVTPAAINLILVMLKKEEIQKAHA